jgi:YD repeat-containing protein
LNISGQWHPPEEKNTYLHHNAKYEMRSKPVSGGHGHQATYDDYGQLITVTIATGSADKYAPYNSVGVPISAKKHRDQDVYPFIRALQLDGNPVHPNNKSVPTDLNRPCIYKGSNTDKYFERRPVLP